MRTISTNAPSSASTTESKGNAAAREKKPARAEQAPAPAAAPARAGVAAVANKDSVEKGLLTPPLAGPRVMVDQAALAALRALAARTAEAAQLEAQFAELANKWGAAPPVAKAAPLFETKLQTLDGQELGFIEVLSRQDVAELAGGENDARAPLEPFAERVLGQLAAQTPTAPPQHQATASSLLLSAKSYIEAAPTEKEREVAAADAVGEGGPQATGALTQRAVRSVGTGDSGSGGESGKEGEADPDVAFADLETKVGDAVKGLPEGDLEALVQIVMMHCAKDAAQDMRQLLKEMQETNKLKKATREYITEQKKRAAELKQILRAEYDRRCALPDTVPDEDPAHISPELTSFEDFMQSQPIVQNGELGFDQTGYPAGSPTYSMSPNYIIHPQAKKIYTDDAGNEISRASVDRARRLRVHPRELARLEQYYANNPDKVARFQSFDQWALAPTEAGGVGLSLAPADKQSQAFGDFIASTAADYPVKLMTSSYGLSEAAATKVEAWWKELGPEVQASYGHSIAHWLGEPPPLGPGMSPTTSPIPDGKIDVVYAAFQNEMNLRKLAADYGVPYGSMFAAKQYFDQHGSGDFATCLSFMFGCAVGQNDNAARIDAAFATMCGSDHPNIARVGAEIRALQSTAQPQQAFALSGIPSDVTFTGAVATLASPVGDPEAPKKQELKGEISVGMLDAQIAGLQDHYDSLGELSQEQSLRMQIYQGRYSKMMELLSNVMKAFSQTSRTIVENMK